MDFYYCCYLSETYSKVNHNLIEKPKGYSIK